MNKEIRSLFPAASNYTYLNSAAVSPIPLTAIEAVNAQLTDVANNGSKNYADWIATKGRCRGFIAQMLGVRAEQVAFMRNTSDGFAAVANGIKWKDTDNIVSFEQEFPANFYPWRMARDRYGVELRLCSERNGRIDLAELIGMIDANTRLVAISAVQYGSGFRADLERVGRAVRDADALFAVDVIQGLGAMGFDLPAQYVDIASGASHKWLCAPEGCGILLCPIAPANGSSLHLLAGSALKHRGTLATVLNRSSLMHSQWKAEPVRRPFFTGLSKALSYWLKAV